MISGANPSGQLVQRPEAREKKGLRGFPQQGITTGDFQMIDSPTTYTTSNYYNAASLIN